MLASQMVKVRRVAAVGVLAALSFLAPARADVLEQVPSDAVAVLKIKDLDALNTKVAKMAKTFGLDEIQPDMKDPLAALLKKGHISKGLNKSGDAALVVFAPEKGAPKGEPIAVALVPVSDYEAFVSNFEKGDAAEAGEGISVVKDPEGSSNMYVAHRGNYAILSDQKEHLTGKATGLKLSAASAREAAAKDMVFCLNMSAIREKTLPELKGHRKEWLDKMHKELGQQKEVQPFVPVLDTLFTEVLDGAENFLEQADGIVFSLNLSDEGLNGAMLVEFAPQSKFGTTVAQMKPGHIPLLAGLPDRKYFIFGGSSADPKVLAPVVNDLVNPIIKDLQASNTDLGKRMVSILESAKTVATSADHSAAGWIVPTKPLGQESIFQQITVTHGDARAMADAEKKILVELNGLMALMPQNKGAKSSIEFGAPKNVDGAELQSYTTKIEVDENDPRGMQAQQMLSMLYGPNGMSGTFGAVNDKTFIVAQGLGDELLKQAIEAAKSEKDVLSDSAGVKAVSAQLPGNHFMVYYIALDNVVNTVVRYAQGFGVPIKMKLPQDLPPVGIAGGTDGSAVRIEGFVPTQTVQSLIAAGIQAYTQMQQGQGGGL